MKYLNTGPYYIIMFEGTSIILIYKKSLLNFTGGLLILVDMRTSCCWAPVDALYAKECAISNWLIQYQSWTFVL
jgi:hypothetical protein